MRAAGGCSIPNSLSGSSGQGWTTPAEKATARARELPTGLPAPSCSCPCSHSCSCSRCRILWVLSADSLASVRRVVQVNAGGNHCCIIWQHCRLLICSLSFTFCCLVWLFCFNTLMPADSMGGGKLVAFAIFPGSPKHFFLR